MNEQYLLEAMQRACVIARRGPRDTPNPQVGCVLVDNSGRIIAEGWHLGAGTPHAEVAALAAATAQGVTDFSALTAVVTLEPCAHTGRTGPCAEALIAAKIGRVVYGASDDSAMAGGGAARLRAAGVEVISGVGEIYANALKQDWLQRAARAADPRPQVRPRVTVKWAQTLDGRAAANDGSSQWITGEPARADVHQRRAAADAIAVGTGTAISDDPSLTARAADGSLLVPPAAQPIPVVFGKSALPATLKLFSHPALSAPAATQSAPIILTGTALEQDLEALAAAGIRSLFVEGGPKLISSLLAADLVDECLIYVAPALLGGKNLALGELGLESISQIKRFTAVEQYALGADTLIRAWRES